MSIVTIGDLHLSDDRPWSAEVSELVVDTLIHHPSNVTANTAVFLGDVSDKAVISGQVIALLERLFHNMKHRKVYVLRGNHELKKNKVGQETYVLDFLRSDAYPNVEVVDTVRDISIEGNRYLMLPYFNPDGTTTMKAEYEKLRFDGTFKAVFGHLQDTSLDIPGESIDLSSINTESWCLGHIHNPTDHYLGSVIPNSSSEAHKLRMLALFDAEGRENLILPTIMDYYDVVYPEPLPVVDCMIPVYTVYNCTDEAIAKEKYGDIYIKRCVYEVSMDIEAFKSLGTSKSESLGSMSSKDMFAEFKKTAKFNPPELAEVAEKYLLASGQ
jgi:DNA repair exonuclease SbcCD nuclease subunit